MNSVVPRTCNVTYAKTTFVDCKNRQMVSYDRLFKAVKKKKKIAPTHDRVFMNKGVLKYGVRKNAVIKNRLVR